MRFFDFNNHSNAPRSFQSKHGGPPQPTGHALLAASAGEASPALRRKASLTARRAAMLALYSFIYLSDALLFKHFQSLQHIGRQRSRKFRFTAASRMCKTYILCVQRLPFYKRISSIQTISCYWTAYMTQMNSYLMRPPGHKPQRYKRIIFVTL